MSTSDVKNQQLFDGVRITPKTYRAHESLRALVAAKLNLELRPDLDPEDVHKALCEAVDIIETAATITQELADMLTEFRRHRGMYEKLLKNQHFAAVDALMFRAAQAGDVLASV